ncbi:phosphoglycolate phosphatase, bacterial [Betaproteobacteria bacterium]|nr:phosphoglycolate phosphatase, bacterial [Betaproteobacteria bacterium]GHU41690.1 phosphoglycolate phosphatase, bacterial [Betaproteobacteria bacterium]
MPVSSVTFDLDGTLLDTARDIFVACQRVLAEMRQPARSEADIRRFVGRGMDELITRCLFWDTPPTHADVEEGMRLFRRFYVEENGRATQAYPGVVAGLRAFHASGLPLAVVTNKSAAFTRPLLEQTGLAGYFRQVVCGDSTPFKKPHPEPILHACRLLGVAPADNLHIGDSVNDALAARAAGSLAWLVPYGYTEGKPLSADDCDALICDFPTAWQKLETLRRI